MARELVGGFDALSRGGRIVAGAGGLGAVTVDISALSESSPAQLIQAPRLTTPRIRRVFEIFSSGFASRSTRSAGVPTAIVPLPSVRPRNLAGLRVADSSAWYGVSPAATSNSSSRCND